MDSPFQGVCLEGALDVEPAEHGWVPRRLPSWTRAVLPDAWFDHTVTVPTAVRLVTRTSATVIELEQVSRRLELPGVGALPAVFDLVVNGRPVARQQANGGTLLRIGPDGGLTGVRPGKPETIRFTGLPAFDKHVELWLPNAAVCELTGFAANAAPRAPGPTARPRWVHYGSSVSHGTEADGPTASWLAVAALRCAVEPLCLSFPANALLDPFVASTIAAEEAEVISLELGLDVVERGTLSEQAFCPAVHGFLDTIREHHPRTPILLVSPIVCPPLEHHGGPVHAGPSERGEFGLARARELLASLVAERAATGEPLSYVDGRNLLGPGESAHLYDGVHPDAWAHRRMGERFSDVLSPILLRLSAIPRQAAPLPGPVPRQRAGSLRFAPLRLS